MIDFQGQFATQEEALNTSIAKICHQANKAWCEVTGDNSQKDWDEAEEWQRESAIKGVAFKIANPDAGHDAQHNSWMKEKVDAGTDKIFKTGDIPSRHIPARPDSAYDLLVGELILRFKERLCPPPVGAEELRAEAERILKSKLDGKIMVANSPDFTFNKVIEAMIEFRHSPGEPEAKAIAEAAFTAGELYGSDKVNVLKPGGEIYLNKEQYLNRLKYPTPPFPANDAIFPTK